MFSYKLECEELKRNRKLNRKNGSKYKKKVKKKHVVHSIWFRIQNVYFKCGIEKKSEKFHTNDWARKKDGYVLMTKEIYIQT